MNSKGQASKRPRRSNRTNRKQSNFEKLENDLHGRWQSKQKVIALGQRATLTPRLKHYEMAQQYLTQELGPGYDIPEDGLVYTAAQRYFEVRKTVTNTQVDELGMNSRAEAATFLVQQELIVDPEIVPNNLTEVNRGIHLAKVSLHHVARIQDQQRLVAN